MHGTLPLTKRATVRQRSIKASIIVLAVLGIVVGVAAGAVLVYTPLGDQFLTFSVSPIQRIAASSQRPQPLSKKLDPRCESRPSRSALHEPITRRRPSHRPEILVGAS
jgi:hypothetical protein